MPGACRLVPSLSSIDESSCIYTQIVTAEAIHMSQSQTDSQLVYFQAIHRKLTYPKYAWIMYDWYPKRWWTKLDPSVVKCKAEDIARFLDKVLTLRRYPETDDISATTEAGIVRIYNIYSSIHVCIPQIALQTHSVYTYIYMWHCICDNRSIPCNI